MLVSICAYGRAANARSCARRSLAAETIFMALVICRVLITLRMRRLMSRMFAIENQLLAVSSQLSALRRLLIADCYLNLARPEPQKVLVILSAAKDLLFALVSLTTGWKSAK